MRLTDMTEYVLHQLRPGLRRQMRVPLRHGKRSMPEYVSDFQQRCAALGEITRARMSQIMKADTVEARKQHRASPRLRDRIRLVSPKLAWKEQSVWVADPVPSYFCADRWCQCQTACVAILRALDYRGT